VRLLRNSARPFQVTSLGGRSLSGACVAICGVSFFSFGKKVMHCISVAPCKHATGSMSLGCRSRTTSQSSISLAATR